MCSYDLTFSRRAKMATNFEHEFNKLDLGNALITFPTYTIISENGSKIVAHALFEKHLTESTDYISVLESENTNCYIVKNKNRYSSFQIKSTDKLETFVIDHGFNENRENNVVAILNGKSINLKKGTPITDINSIRYQLRNNKKAAAFIDAFVFTDDKDRKTYALYEKKQQYIEQKTKQSVLKNKKNIYR